ncbi:hypothetical protein FRC12_017743 [Ceratobasidium sp. 428]|nr:hypothetical protein FRC12_017743 [Ceratobasidium sp. 428]
MSLYNDTFFQGGWNPEGQPSYVPPASEPYNRPESRATHVSHVTNLDADQTFQAPERPDILGQDVLDAIQSMRSQMNAHFDWLDTAVHELYNRTDHLHNHFGAQMATRTGLDQVRGDIHLVRQYVQDTYRDTQALIGAIPLAQPVVPQLTGVNRPVPPPPAIQTSTTQASGGIKLAKPDKLDGKDKSKSKAFWVAITQYLRAVYPRATVDKQILFIISYLEGAALDWLQPFQEADIDPRSPVTFLHSLQSFWSEFDKRFGEINRA